MTVNICKNCKKEFKCTRRDKKNCSRSCDWEQERQRESPRPSELMLALGLVLKGAAPEGTAGYRLGLPPKRPSRKARAAAPNASAASAAEPLWFPPAHQRSRRWDGSYSEQPYFVLNRTVFEPPRVPVAGSYLIQFVTAAGLLLPTPSVFESGVTVAEAARMTWPGTHHVRQPRQGTVRSLVELVSTAKTS